MVRLAKLLSPIRRYSSVIPRGNLHRGGKRFSRKNYCLICGPSTKRTVPTSFTTKSLSLLIALVAMTAALVLQLFFIDYFRSETQYLRDVTRNVGRAMRDIEKDAEQLKERLTNPNVASLADLAYPTTYPYYLFEHGKLKYWSDYRQVPDYRSLRSTDTYAYRTLPSGSYVVRRDSLPNSSWEVFFLLPVRRDAKLDNQYVSSGYNPDLFPEGAAATMAANVVDIDARARLIRYENQPLLGVTLQPPPGGYREHRTARLFQSLISGLVALAILLVLYNIGRLIRWSRQHRRIDLAVVLVTLSLVGVRTLMLVFNFPYTVIPLQLFDYRYFASSVVNPSLGDLLLNCLGGTADRHLSV